MDIEVPVEEPKVAAPQARKVVMEKEVPARLEPKKKVSWGDKLKSLLPKPKEKKPKEPRKPRETKPRETKPKKPREVKPKKPNIKPRESKPKVEPKPKPKPQTRPTRRTANTSAGQEDNSNINNLLNSETYGIKDKGIINKHEQIGGEGRDE